MASHFCLDKALLISIGWTSFMIISFMIQKTYSETNSTLCADTHYDITTFKIDIIILNIII